VKLVALSGSLRAGSFSTAALRAALASAQRAGAQTKLCDLREIDLPLFRPEAPIAAYPRAARAHVERLVADFRDADLMLWATPTYHGTMTGALKNALDYMELLRDEPAPYLQGKAVGLIALSDASPHAGMAACVSALRGWLAPTRVTLQAADFDAGLALTCVTAQRRVTRLVEELLHFAAR
jgi:FMN reductase